MEITSAKVKQAQDYLDNVTSNQELAGCSALLKENEKELLYLQSGFANIEKKTPFTRNAICRLYSVSKVFTAVAVYKAFELNLFKIDDPISNFFPNFAKAKIEINEKLIDIASPTIRQLLNMEGGFAYGGKYVGKEYEKIVKGNYKESTIEFGQNISTYPLDYAPGTKRQYSICADLLGAVIEITSKMKFGDFLKKYIFDPIGLKNTFFVVPIEKRLLIPSTYTKNENKTVPFSNYILGINGAGDNNNFQSGGAGLFSTIDDVSCFGVNLLKGEIISLKSLKELSEVKENEINKQIDWMADEHQIYKNLVQIRKTIDEEKPYSFVNDFGWNGWLGCDLILNLNRKSVFVFFTQQENYGQGKVNNKLREILYK